MNRRYVLGVTAAVAVVGCTGPTVTEPPTGELDVTFRTEATRDYLIRLTLVDADGTVEDEFESGFPPDQAAAPSYYTGGRTNGPYTVTIETEADRATVEWSITDCASLHVTVTVLEDGRLDVDRTCRETD